MELFKLDIGHGITHIYIHMLQLQTQNSTRDQLQREGHIKEDNFTKVVSYDQ